MGWPNNSILRNEPLSRHTSFRIGGPAEWFAEPASLDELVRLLQDAKKAGLPVWVLSGGTNTLAADRGVRGLVIHLGGGFRQLHELGQPDEPIVRVRCGAAVQTQRLVFLAARHGWGALERLAGLPGQIGGAVAMNAQDVGVFVQQLTLVTFDGAVCRLGRQQLRFRYRDAAIEPGIVVDVELAFPRIAQALAERQIRQCLARRNETQEIRLPSAGCAFRNPAGVGAGWLIDQAGLKGTRIGDALISTRHANFIVNLGYASSDHVLALMELTQRRIQKAFGVTLEPEVRIMGQSWNR